MPYRGILLDFFEDARSGKYQLTGNVYARAALVSIKALFNPYQPEYAIKFFGFGCRYTHVLFKNRHIYDPGPFLKGFKSPDALTFSQEASIGHPEAELFYDCGLQFVTLLLSKASALMNLYSLLRDHPLANSTQTAIPDKPGLSELRSEVRKYLKVSVYNLFRYFF